MEPYKKTTWLERLGVGLQIYAKSDETTNQVTLQNDPTSISQAGTAFTKARMNNMERGIDQGCNNRYYSVNGFYSSQEMQKEDINQVCSVVLDTGRIILGGTDYIMYSDDSGASFNKVLVDASMNGIRALVVADNGNVIAGGSSNDIIAYSTDDGLTWTSSTATGIGYVNDLAVANNGNVIAATQAYLAYSTDNGVTWTKLLGVSEVYTLVIADNGNVVGGGFAAAYYSTDNGLTYSTVAIASISGIASLVVSDNGNVVGGASNYAVYSDDNGVTWSSVSISSVGSIGSLVIADNGNVVGGASNYAVYSDDNGVTWSSVSIASTGAIASLAISGNGDIIGGASNYVVYSTNNGTSWSSIAIASTGDYKIAIELQSGFVLLVSNDGYLYYIRDSSSYMLSINKCWLAGSQHTGNLTVDMSVSGAGGSLDGITTDGWYNIFLIGVAEDNVDIDFEDLRLIAVGEEKLDTWTLPGAYNVAQHLAVLRYESGFLNMTTENNIFVVRKTLFHETFTAGESKVIDLSEFLPLNTKKIYMMGDSVTTASEYSIRSNGKQVAYFESSGFFNVSTIVNNSTTLHVTSVNAGDIKLISLFVEYKLI